MKADSRDASRGPGKSAPHIDDHLELSMLNARAGLWLFFVYLAFYAGFMSLATFAPRAMAMPVVAGVNLAITYGVALIVGALVIAGIYMAICGRNLRRVSQEGPR